MTRSVRVAAATLSMTLALLAWTSVLAVPAPASGLGHTRTVYLLRMSSGLDQYLAVGLTKGSVLQVVADPQKADAIFTDHLGEGLEAKLDDLYGSQKKTNIKGEGKGGEGKPGDDQTFTRVTG